MIAGRVLAGGSKLALTRQLASCTLGEELGVQAAVHDDLYAAMDWLLERQSAIEQRLARRHLKEGELALYDVSCSYFEGAPARWRGLAMTTAMASADGCRLSTGCCVTVTGGRWRSRRSKDH